MPQQPFVMRLHFYLRGKSSGRQSLKSAAHHIEYMGSKEKAELLIDGLLDEENTHTTLESAAIHAKYAREREGSMGYFGSMAHDPKAAEQSILAAKGPVWRVIASVGESDALNMGGDLTTKSGWDKASNIVVPQMIAQLGLDPAKVQWIAAAHRHQKHENNPHIHLLLWEQGIPSRKTAKWSDTERKAIRKAWITELYRPERQHLGIEKSEARDQARHALIDLIATRNDQQGFHRELVARLAVLGGMLPGSGRLAYGYMPPPVKSEVESTIRWLWSADPSLKSAHDRFLASAEGLGTAYWHRDPSKTQDTPGRQAALDRIKANAETDLIKRLAGPVLKAAKESQAQQSHKNLHRNQALVGALHRIILKSERDARLTALWISESEYQRKKAQAAIAQSTGQQLSL